MNISVRPAKQSDFSFFNRMFSDPANTKWLRPIFRRAAYSELFHYYMTTKLSNVTYVVLLGKKKVGYVGFNDITKKNKDANLGYVMAEKKLRNRGIMTHAVRLFLDKMFKTETIKKAYAFFKRGNLASRRVLEKNGFIKDGNRWVLYG